MELILSSLDIFLRWDVWAAILVGSIGGVIIGAIPGVGPAVAIAILLPATYSMDPIIGITVLLGIYGSAMYGGAIPAILINTPGTPVNALTTYDGYSMTKDNKARRAITLAYWSSFTGGIFSIIALIFMTSLIAKVAPLFGSRDILMAALLGLILVIISHRKQTLIAGMLVFFGMFISTIGMESVDAKVGLKTEIIPLTRPYGIYTGNVFRGLVLVNGKPAPFCRVEVEYNNVGEKYKAPADPFINQVVKTDQNGVFAFAMPAAGWWGFAALNEGKKKIKYKGKSYPVELGAVIWVRTRDMKGNK